MSHTSSSSNKLFSCQVSSCDRTFTRKKALQDHLQGPAHANSKPFHCTLCSKSFTRSNDLKRHETEVHDEKRFVCEELLPTGTRRGCLKRFSRSTTLKQHQRECEKWKKASHMQPEAQFAWPSAPEAQIRHRVQAEMRNEKRDVEKEWTDWIHEDHFVCKICKAKRRTSYPGSYSRHLHDHLEDIEVQAYQCAACPARFVLQEQLIRHAQSCGKFACSLMTDNFGAIWGCGREFKNAQAFKLHVDEVDGLRCHRYVVQLRKAIKSQLVMCAEEEDLMTGLEQTDLGPFNDVINFLK